MTVLEEATSAPEKTHLLAGTTWPKLWDYQAVVQDDAEALALIKRCPERNLKMLAALSSLRLSGRPRAAVRMSRRYLNSYSARLNALCRAYSRKVRSIRNAPAEDLLGLAKAAAAMSVWDGSDEKSVAYQKERRSGGYRWVHKHGLFQYALEVLAADAAGVLTDLLATQFMSNGGFPKLKLWLDEYLPITALVMTVDIPRCFDTVRRSSLVDNLPLPRWVVQRVLFDPMDFATYLYPGPMGLIPKPGPIAKVSLGMRGIPQGSALSQLSSDVVIAKVMRSVSEIHPSVRVASHGDNLIVLIGDVSFKASVISALTSEVRKLFGPDVSTELTCRIICKSPSAGFAFCRRHYVFKKGCLHISLPADWVSAYGMKTLMKIERAYSIKQDAEWDHIERSIKGWLRHSPKSEPVVNEAADLLAHVKLMRK